MRQECVFQNKAEAYHCCWQTQICQHLSERLSARKVHSLQHITDEPVPRALYWAAPELKPNKNHFPKTILDSNFSNIFSGHPHMPPYW